MSKTAAPQPDIFRKFRDEWSNIDKTKYKAVLEYEYITNKLRDADHS